MVGSRKTLEKRMLNIFYLNLQQLGIISAVCISFIDLSFLGLSVFTFNFLEAGSDYQMTSNSASPVGGY